MYNIICTTFLLPLPHLVQNLQFWRRSHNYCCTFCPEDIFNQWIRQYTSTEKNDRSHKMAVKWKSEWKLRIVFIDLDRETCIWCERFEFDATNLNLIWQLWATVVYFVLSEFVCFDRLWQLATTHACDNTRVREARNSRQNDVTWFDFFYRGNK